MYKKEKFMKNKKSIQVSPYALADVIEALTNDSEHFVDIVVTKEDGHLVVMFNRTHKSCSGLSEGLLNKATAKEDKPDHCPMQGNSDLCDNTTSISNLVFHGCDLLKQIIFKGKTLDEVKQMETYPFGIEDESIIKCEI